MDSFLLELTTYFGAEQFVNKFQPNGYVIVDTTTQTSKCDEWKQTRNCNSCFVSSLKNVQGVTLWYFFFHSVSACISIASHTINICDASASTGALCGLYTTQLTLERLINHVRHNLSFVFAIHQSAFVDIVYLCCVMSGDDVDRRNRTGGWRWWRTIWVPWPYVWSRPAGFNISRHPTHSHQIPGCAAAIFVVSYWTTRAHGNF